MRGARCELPERASTKFMHRHAFLASGTSMPPPAPTSGLQFISASQQGNRVFLVRFALLAALLLGATERLAAANCVAGYSIQNGYCRDYPYFKDRPRSYHFRRGKEEFAFSGGARHCRKGFRVHDGVCVSRTRQPDDLRQALELYAARLRAKGTAQTSCDSCDAPVPSGR